MAYRVKSFDVSNTISGGADIIALAYRYFNAVQKYCCIYGQLNLPVHRNQCQVSLTEQSGAPVED